MSKILKRRFKQVRIEFRRELMEKFKNNPALPMLMIQTYVAWKHRRHIGQIWAMFRNPHFENFKKAYNAELFGRHLTGNEDIWKSLYFSEKELYFKYQGKIPEVYAMGEAVGAAYQFVQEKEKAEAHKKKQALIGKGKSS